MVFNTRMAISPTPSWRHSFLQGTGSPAWLSQSIGYDGVELNQRDPVGPTVKEIEKGVRRYPLALSDSETGRKVLARALERYLDLIRDLETHYAPQEVPGIDVRARLPEPRFQVKY